MLSHAPVAHARGRYLATAHPLPPIPPEQSQSHGEQLSPGGHTGQAHTQPPSPPPLLADRWQTPLTHAVPGLHGAPIAYHTHMFAASVVQIAESVCSVHGSVVPQLHGRHVSPGAHGGHAHVCVAWGGGAPPPPEQSHAHGGHVSPGGHAGQPQRQVSPHVLPPEPPPSQMQSHVKHVSPGAHGAHVHVHVPPPPVPLSGGQSQAHGGQSPSAKQYAGHAHKQALPLPAV